jgi:acetyltransferase
MPYPAGQESEWPVKGGGVYAFRPIHPDGTSCEFTLIVADDHRGQGLGARRMRSIIDAARRTGLAQIFGLILVNNAPMLRLMTSLGCQIAEFAENPDFRFATKAL